MRYATSTTPWRVTTALLSLACLLWAGSLRANDHALKWLQQRTQEAKEYEKKGSWQEACAIYDEILSKDRAQPEIRDAFRHALRQFRQDSRHLDSSLRVSVEKLSPAEALSLFDQVLDLVSTRYVEKDRLELTALIHEAIREIKHALAKKNTFIKFNLPRARDTELDVFKARLDYWLQRKFTTRTEAREVVRDLTLGGIPLYMKPGVLALEMACGMCNSLDEYSFYLAPGRIAHLQTAQRNKFVGIGVELMVSDQKIEVSRVYRKSPAAEAGLTRGDRITRIGGQWIDPLAPEAAAERLMGEPGSKVEVEIIPRGRTVTQTLKIERQAVQANSVEYQLVSVDDENYLGYIRIHNFQETTAQEVKLAIEELRGSQANIKGLILDLRGNLGGLFKPSVEVTELFIGEGVIVHTYSPLRELNQTIAAKNRSPNLWPLVILIDGDTASSAEVVAGALKDHKRATLMGQTTYGKGSIQRVYPLERLPGGLKLTVAKFTSPLRNTYADKGVTPDITLDNDADPVKQAAQLLLPMTAMMR